MSTFTAYLVRRLPLCEVTELFPIVNINDLFKSVLLEVLPVVEDKPIRDDLVQFLDTNFILYMDRSLANAGFKGDELDDLVHDLVAKLLVSPKGLVSGWRMEGPISARFKKSVKNYVITAWQKAKRRRRIRELPDDQIQQERPRSNEDLIHDFREWIRMRVGEPAVKVFDARLADEDIKNLVGQEGIPSNYALKQLIKRIKSQAVIWAGTDPAFQIRVQKIMDAESQTLARRFGRGTVGVG